MYATQILWVVGVLGAIAIFGILGQLVQLARKQFDEARAKRRFLEQRGRRVLVGDPTQSMSRMQTSLRHAEDTIRAKQLARAREKFPNATDEEALKLIETLGDLYALSQPAEERRKIDAQFPEDVERRLKPGVHLDPTQGDVPREEDFVPLEDDKTVEACRGKFNTADPFFKDPAFEREERRTMEEIMRYELRKDPLDDTVPEQYPSLLSIAKKLPHVAGVTKGLSVHMQEERTEKVVVLHARGNDAIAELHDLLKHHTETRRMI